MSSSTNAPSSSTDNDWRKNQNKETFKEFFKKIRDIVVGAGLGDVSENEAKKLKLVRIAADVAEKFALLEKALESEDLHEDEVQAEINDLEQELAIKHKLIDKITKNLEKWSKELSLDGLSYLN